MTVRIVVIGLIRTKFFIECVFIERFVIRWLVWLMPIRRYVVKPCYLGSSIGRFPLL